MLVITDYNPRFEDAAVIRRTLLEGAATAVHPAEVHDTMSFYNFFKDDKHKLGKHRIWVCRSISCMLRGGEEVLEKVCSKFHIHPGQTSSDGKVTLEYAECLGACEGAPCILVDDECHTDVNAESVSALIEKL